MALTAEEAACRIQEALQNYKERLFAASLSDAQVMVAVHVDEMTDTAYDAHVQEQVLWGPLDNDDFDLDCTSGCVAFSRDSSFQWSAWTNSACGQWFHYRIAQFHFDNLPKAVQAALLAQSSPLMQRIACEWLREHIRVQSGNRVWIFPDRALTCIKDYALRA